MVNDDDDVKMILLHGGSFFSSGNDLGAFADAFKNKESPAKMLEKADYGVNTVLTGMLLNMSKCNKPIVTVVRGGSVGIGFTMLSHSTFVYCSPDAYFKTPFMGSG